MASKAKRSKSKTNLLLDVGLFGLFLATLEPESTGLALHEWLGLSFAGAVVAHLVLHWKWMVHVTRRFFGKLALQARINYILNVLLFFSMATLAFSGLVISRVAAPDLLALAASERIWRGLHEVSANLSFALIGLHLALHWKWILSMFGKYLVKPVTALAATRKPQVVPARSERS